MITDANVGSAQFSVRAVQTARLPFPRIFGASEQEATARRTLLPVQ